MLPRSPTGSEVKPSPSVGCGLIPVSWLLDCPARHPWTALEQNLQSFPPPSPACLALPALTRPVATAVQINDEATLVDELIDSLGSTVCLWRLIPSIFPSTLIALTCRALCLRNPASFAANMFECGGASRPSTASSR